MKLARTLLVLLGGSVVVGLAAATPGPEQDARRLYRQYDGLKLEEMEIVLTTCRDALAEDASDCLRWRDLAVARWKYGNLLSAGTDGAVVGPTGFLDGAFEAFETALMLCPEEIELQRGLARAHYDADDLDAALTVFSDLIARWPDDARALASTGRIQVKLGDLDAAEAAYTRALEIDPKVIPRSVLADVLRDLGKSQDAAQQRQLHSEATAAERVADVEVRRRKRELMTQLGTNQVVRDAFDLMREGRYEEAILRYDQGIASARGKMDDGYFSEAALALTGQLEATKRMMLLEFKKRER